MLGLEIRPKPKVPRTSDTVTIGDEKYVRARRQRSSFQELQAGY
jgi:hypothetical protein